MNAVISGTAGQALLIDGESLRSLDVENPSSLVVRTQADLPYLFGEGRDLRFIEDTDLDSIVKALNSESNLSLALDLTLISLDQELEEDIRKDAIRDLDELVNVAEVKERLEGIMYARPLPDDGDLAGALKFCNKSEVPHSVALFDDLERRQTLISKVSAAWEAIPTKDFGDDEQKSYFQHVAVREGLFRSLVIALEAPNTILSFLLTAGLDPAVTHLRNSRRVLQQWAAPFRQTAATVRISPGPEEEFETEVAPKRRHGRRVGIDRQAVRREVNERKAIISAAIGRRDFNRVSALVNDLVSFQRSSGETEHLAKSLCDLAMEAKQLGLFQLHLDLTERSIGEAPDDGWSWAQYGDALLTSGRFAEALYSFEQSEAFGAGSVAKNGRAEVLKAQGELGAALAAYEEGIRLHPEDVVAKTGRAEVLKAQGELGAALAAYEEVTKLHPENVFAKTGRAEVLKAQGELGAALAAYEEVIKLHPENVFAKTGRAEVLKAQGEFGAALAAYEEVIKLYPENVVAKNGRAEVLKAQGELGAALAAYEEVIKLHPENVFAKNGRAEVLKAQGELGAALAAYEEVIKLHPEDVVAKSGRAEVLKAQGELGAALAAYEEGIRLHPEDVVARTGRAEVLKAQGELGAALAAYEEVIRLHPEDVVAKNGRAEVLKAQGELGAALAAYEEVIKLHPEDVVAKNGRAQVLKAQGELGAALAAYEEVIKLHPEDVVAKNGRAEVLRASGKLGDSLSAYDEIRFKHPNDPIARNGRSCVLASLHRYEEALENLPVSAPIGVQDWIGFHIRGMVLMRMKRMDDALDVFRRGANESPYAANKPYFDAAIAMALMRQGEFTAAKEVVSHIDSPHLRPQIAVVHLHIAGEQRRFDEAQDAFEDLNPRPWSISDELVDELHRRYILKAPPKHSDDWVFDQEAESLLVVANQQSSVSWAY